MRELILRAATELFQENGYHATRTRDIAERSGVGESVVFRNFGSKAELFETVVLSPFSGFIDEWVHAWEDDPPSTDSEIIVRSFVKGFYDLLLEHRPILRTLIAAREQAADETLDRIAEETSRRFAVAVRGMQRLVLEQGGARHYQLMDPQATVVCYTGMVMSVVLLDDWLMPAGQRRLGKARLLEEMTQMILHGIAHRAGSSVPARAATAVT